MSPLDDLLKRTLAAVNGVWDRLRYLAALRDAKGCYEHWGFTRVHGELSAQAAFSQAHTMLFSQVLRTPLSELLQEIELTAGESKMSGEKLVKAVQEAREQCAPDNLGGGSRRHFNSVLDAISLLHSAHRNSTDPGA